MNDKHWKDVSLCPWNI